MLTTRLILSYFYTVIGSDTYVPMHVYMYDVHVVHNIPPTVVDVITVGAMTDPCAPERRRQQQNIMTRITTMAPTPHKAPTTIPTVCPTPLKNPEMVRM